jgi:hypothetical protein
MRTLVSNYYNPKAAEDKQRHKLNDKEKKNVMLK